MNRIAKVMFAAVMAAGAMPALGATITVNPGQSIQAAIDAAGVGDDIVVLPGTYNGDLDFMGKAVPVRSSAGAASTIIDGTGTGPVITFNTGEGSDSVVDGFTITGGNSTLGGGIFASNATPTIRRCIITGNSANAGGGAYHAGGANVAYIGCVFTGNSANQGGGLYNSLSSPSLINCTLVGDTADIGAGMHNPNFQSRPGVTNCIIWGYQDDWSAGQGEPIVSYSAIDVTLGSGVGNISADPMFVDEAGGNFQLQAGSPCIDAGNSAPVAAILFTDLNGDMRGVDDPATGDTGVASFGLVVDMGAFEFQAGGGSNCGGCVGDIVPIGSGNGVVNIDDLLEVINAFGPCPVADPVPTTTSAPEQLPEPQKEETSEEVSATDRVRSDATSRR